MHLKHEDDTRSSHLLSAHHPLLRHSTRLISKFHFFLFRLSSTISSFLFFSIISILFFKTWLCCSISFLQINSRCPLRQGQGQPFSCLTSTNLVSTISSALVRLFWFIKSCPSSSFTSFSSSTSPPFLSCASFDFEPFRSNLIHPPPVGSSSSLYDFSVFRNYTYSNSAIWPGPFSVQSFCVCRSFFNRHSSLIIVVVSNLCFLIDRFNVLLVLDLIRIIHPNVCLITQFVC